MRKIFVILLSFIVVFTSCHKKLDVWNSSIIKEKAILDDSSYISFSLCTIEYNGLHYMSDFKNNRILVFDNNLKLVKTFGGTGRGPCELISVSEIYVCNDSLYVYDPNQQKIVVYDIITAKCIREIKPKYRIYRKFIIKDNNIISCHPYSDKPIIIMDMNGNLTGSFGKLINKYDDIEKYTTNRWDVLDAGNNIITVNVSDPIIDIYDKNLSLIKRIDISDHKVFSALYESKNKILKENPKSRKYTTFYAIANSYIQGNNIYLLYWEDDGSGNSYVKNILVFDYKKGVITSSIKLNPFERISSFDIKNDTLLAFDQSSARLGQFKLIKN